MTVVLFWAGCLQALKIKIVLQIAEKLEVPPSGWSRTGAAPVSRTRRFDRSMFRCSHRHANSRRRSPGLQPNLATRRVRVRDILPQLLQRLPSLHVLAQRQLVLPAQPRQSRDALVLWVEKGQHHTSADKLHSRKKCRQAPPSREGDRQTRTPCVLKLVSH